MDESGNSQNRRNKRSLVLIAAKVRTKQGAVEVRLRNLSRNGALLEADVPPAEGTEVVFERGDTIAEARVAWVSKQRFGIQFDRPIEESEVLNHIGKPQHNGEMDPRAFRRAGFRERDLKPGERKIGEAWFHSLGTATPLGE
jgi:PilZ domain-containing protein